MASSVPPVPVQDPAGSFAWLEWYRQLQSYLSTGSSVPWAVVDKAGANITDIPTRTHNSLQTIQGGAANNYYHFKRALEGSKTHDFPNIGAVATSTTTVTITGAVAGDHVLVTPDSALEAGINIYGYVSAADTVTIVANNSSAGAINPASRTYYVLVTKVS